MESGVLSFDCKQSQCPAYDRCDLVPTQVRVIKGTERPDEVILFIGDSVGKHESANSLPFQGRGGDLLRKTIRKLNVRKLTIAYTSITRYWPRNENGERCEPDPEAVSSCMTHLLRDVEHLKPSKIVALGSKALKILFPDAPGILKSRGKHFDHPQLGQIFVTYDPGLMLKKQNLFYQWEADLQLMLSSDKLVSKSNKWSKPYEWRLLSSVDEIEEYVEELINNKKLKIIALDTETKNLNARYDNTLGTLQFSEDGKRGTVIPYHHPKAGWWPDELKRIDNALIKLFTTPNPPWKYWVFHNAGFDYRMIFNFALGVTNFNRPLMDTGMMAYSQDENRGKSGIDKPYSLDSLLRDYLKVEKYEDKEIEQLKKQGKLLEIEIDRLAKYGASDSVYTFRLFFYILERAKREGYKDKLLKLCKHWFEPVSRMNSIMQSNGFWVDEHQLRVLGNNKTSPIVKRMEEIEKGWRSNANAIEANKRLVESSLGGKMASAFGGGKGSWEFSIDKMEHKRCLFFDVMNLEPLDYGKGTRIPLVEAPEGKEVAPTPVGKLDRAFQDRYSDLEEVALYHEWQGLKKLKTSYVTSIESFLDPRNGKEGAKDSRVRPTFWVTTTDTGRSSCTNPNLQQVPRADNWAKKEIKNMFAAEPGCALIQLDFMTSEVRWWGILAQCPALAKAFENGKIAREDYKTQSENYSRKHPKLRYEVVMAAEKMITDKFEMKKNSELNELKGKFPTKALKLAYRLMKNDIEFFNLIKTKVWSSVAGDLHKNTASQMYSVPLLEVNKSMRNDTKAIVFGTMFGRGPKAIAQQLKIADINDVQQKIRNFFDQFPDAEAWMYDSEKFGERNAYVESPIGRRRRLLTFQMGFGDEGEIARAKRIARNSPIQGISSDGAFLGASMFSEWLIEEGKWHVHPDKKCWLLQDVVHDSLVLQVPIEDVPEALQAVEPFFSTKLMERMENVWDINFNIELEVDFEIGLKWGDLVSWDGTNLHLDYLMNQLRKQESERQNKAA